MTSASRDGIGWDGLLFASATTLMAGFWVACQDSSVSPSDVDLPTSAKAAIRQASESLDRQLGGLELRFKEIEDSVPGFAGFYIDRETGDLIMRLTDLNREAQLRHLAEREAVERMGSDGSQPAIRYETAEYSFSELRGFRGAMFPHLDRKDVVFVDIDEVANQLSIGVTSETARQELLILTSRSGIPGGGVHIGLTVRNSVNRGSPDMNTARLVPSGTLSDHQDTIIGGVLIKVDAAACTAWIGSTINQGTEVFATASHCDAASFAQLDTTVMYAHHFTSHDAAKEWKDPAPKSCSPSPCQYRWADVALYKALADSSDKFSQGWFAQTTNQTGSKTFHSTQPVLRIEGEISVPTVGQEVHHIGYASGWRKGPVIRTGVDQPNWDGSGIWLLDQDEAVIVNGTGDSGAPVVRNVSGKWKIVGIHVGGRAGDTALFSAMWNIESDVGYLATLGWPWLE